MPVLFKRLSPSPGTGTARGRSQKRGEQGKKKLSPVFLARGSKSTHGEGTRGLCEGRLELGRRGGVSACFPGRCWQDPEDSSPTSTHLGNRAEAWVWQRDSCWCTETTAQERVRPRAPCVAQDLGPELSSAVQHWPGPQGSQELLQKCAEGRNPNKGCE